MFYYPVPLDDNELEPIGDAEEEQEPTPRVRPQRDDDEDRGPLIEMSSAEFRELFITSRRAVRAMIREHMIIDHHMDIEFENEIGFPDGIYQEVDDSRSGFVQIIAIVVMLFLMVAVHFIPNCRNLYNWAVVDEDISPL